MRPYQQTRYRFKKVRTSLAPDGLEGELSRFFVAGAPQNDAKYANVGRAVWLDPAGKTAFL